MEKIVSMLRTSSGQTTMLPSEKRIRSRKRTRRKRRWHCSEKMREEEEEGALLSSKESSRIITKLVLARFTV